MPGLRVLLARIKRNFFKTPFLKDQSFPAYWLDRCLSNSAATIVQIGSNDGKTGDPLFSLLHKNKRWSALFVEPVPYSFEKLKSNYSGESRFRFENVAVNNGEQLTFYWVDKKAKDALPDLPYWYDQLGSFNKDHILQHFDGALKPYVKTALLEGVTLQHLLDRNKIEKIDILHIDTEGYDWNILSQLNLNKYRPGFILFEYNHLSEKELIAAKAFLSTYYHVFNMGIDLLAVSKSLDEKAIAKMMEKMTLI
ncbi:MAG: FkbM family methyltransferase [Saprospiraceae bacterium]